MLDWNHVHVRMFSPVIFQYSMSDAQLVRASTNCSIWSICQRA